ncbi:MAG: hypothetical protein WAW39_24980 [Prosthecobacter sp.]|uniref:hypothetical protein n=1 Tax=Prosthecobacter sp. TaxID=1965333 RepID=UPI003BB0EA23
MKTLLNILIIATLVSTSAFADSKVKAGPRKGLLLYLEGCHAEFFVEKDRTISIAFYEASIGDKAQPIGERTATATAEAPSGKVKLEFEKKGDLLVSKAPLPEGEGYTVVMQVKETPSEKPTNFRIKLLLHECEKCHNPEYACICDE